jgi:uncharacterized protein YecE (DUF72 family)
MAGKDNPVFLDASLFLSSFLTPLRPYQEQTGLLIFEFSRFYPGQFERGRDFLAALDSFLSKLPTSEWNFGVELRNESLLRNEYFEILAKHQVAHVYNQWTHMPDLATQVRSFPAQQRNSPVGARLLLKSGRPYQEAVDNFFPYRKTKEEATDTRLAAADLIRQRLSENSPRKSFLYVNNRLEGNALNTIAGILDLLG